MFVPTVEWTYGIILQTAPHTAKNWRQVGATDNWFFGVSFAGSYYHVLTAKMAAWAHGASHSMTTDVSRYLFCELDVKPKTLYDVYKVFG